MTKTAVATAQSPPPRGPSTERRSRLPYLGAVVIAAAWLLFFVARDADSESSLPDLAGALVTLASFVGVLLAWVGRRRSSPRTAPRRVGAGVILAVVALVAVAVFWPAQTVTVSGGGTSELPTSTTTSSTAPG